MICLSIQQPWAYAILHLGKDSENRTWELPRKFIGKRCLVHAGKKIDKEAFDIIEDQISGDRLHEMQFEIGAILGSVRILGCDRKWISNWDAEDQFHFRLAAPIAFDNPIPYRGQLGFFEVPDSLLPEVR